MIYYILLIDEIFYVIFMVTYVFTYVKYFSFLFYVFTLCLHTASQHSGNLLFISLSGSCSLFKSHLPQDLRQVERPAFFIFFYNISTKTKADRTKRSAHSYLIIKYTVYATYTRTMVIPIPLVTFFVFAIGRYVNTITATNIPIS